MVKRSPAAKRKRRKAPTRTILPRSGAHMASHEAAAIDALFDAFAHNLARKLAARAERTGGGQSRKPRGETR